MGYQLVWNRARFTSNVFAAWINHYVSQTRRRKLHLWMICHVRKKIFFHLSNWKIFTFFNMHKRCDITIKPWKAYQTTLNKFRRICVALLTHNNTVHIFETHLITQIEFGNFQILFYIVNWGITQRNIESFE